MRAPTLPPVRRYLVTLTPAIRRFGGGHRAVIVRDVPDGVHEVEARSFVDLETAIRRLVQETGQSCTAYVVMANPRERKPDGFAEWSMAIAQEFLEYSRE
jgi:hypothetical protein